MIQSLNFCPNVAVLFLFFQDVRIVTLMQLKGLTFTGPQPERTIGWSKPVFLYIAFLAYHLMEESFICFYITVFSWKIDFWGRYTLQKLNDSVKHVKYYTLPPPRWSHVLCFVFAFVLVLFVCLVGFLLCFVQFTIKVGNTIGPYKV